MKTTDELLKDLRDAKEAESAAAEALRIAARDVEKAKAEINWHVHGVRERSIVRRERDGCLYRVTKLSYWGSGVDSRPSLEGEKQKKDGSFSERSVYIGSDYEIVTP